MWWHLDCACLTSLKNVLSCMHTREMCSFHPISLWMQICILSRHRMGGCAAECRNCAVSVHIRKQKIKCVVHFSAAFLSWKIHAVTLCPTRVDWPFISLRLNKHESSASITEIDTLQDVIRYSRKENRKRALPLFSSLLHLSSVYWLLVTTVTSRQLHFSRWHA